MLDILGESFAQALRSLLMLLRLALPAHSTAPARTRAVSGSRHR
jgi:hypothetical protein